MPMMTDQTILEKFEFFPIKCRVQRSTDVFNIAQEHRNEAVYKPFRLKVKDTDLKLLVMPHMIWFFVQASKSPACMLFSCLPDSSITET